jgi:hypothetical protein
MLKKILSLFRKAKASDAELQTAKDFIVSARANLAEQTKEHAFRWHFGKEQGWSADMRSGTISFKFASGQTGIAKFQMIGIFDELTSSFHWGWAHPKLTSDLRQHANLARQWGQYNKNPAFLSDTVPCTLEQVWDFAAVTNSLADSKGVYRGHAGKKYIFMTLGEIELETKKATPNWAALAKS